MADVGDEASAAARRLVKRFAKATASYVAAKRLNAKLTRKLAASEGEEKVASATARCYRRRLNASQAREESLIRKRDTARNRLLKKEEVTVWTRAEAEAMYKLQSTYNATFILHSATPAATVILRKKGAVFQTLPGAESAAQQDQEDEAEEEVASEEEAEEEEAASEPEEELEEQEESSSSSGGYDDPAGDPDYVPDPEGEKSDSD